MIARPGIRAAACALAALTLVLACAAPAFAAPLGAPLEPRGEKVWFGISDTGDPADFGAFSTALDKHPAVIESFRNWGSDFPESIRRWQTARARPMIHVTSADNGDGHEILTPKAIAEGGGDDYLIRLNHVFAEKDMAGYLRPLGEPNRCLNVYAAYDCGGNPRGGPHTARWYKLAFRRFYVIVHGGGKAKTINRRLAEAGLGPLNASIGGLPKAPVAIVWSPLPSGSPTVPGNRPRHFWPGSRWVDWSGTDFYAGYPEWDSLTGLYNRYPNKPFALTEWGIETGDDPAFVRRLFKWVERHPRCKMLVYYQDFGSSSVYRIQNYSASLAVLKDRLHSGRFPAYAPGAPHLPPPPPGGIGTPGT